MIGERIKELRKKNRYTQKEIGEMCGVSDISVYKWETDRTEPNIDTLCKLADIFGVSLDYLLGRTTEHEIKKEAPPAMARATEIAPTVPPVGMAILAPKDTRKRARHWQFVRPRRVTMPEPSRCTMQRDGATGVSLNSTF